MTTLWTYTNIINQFVITKPLSVHTLNDSQKKKQYFNEWNNAWVREDLVVTRISKAQLNVKSNEIPLFMFYLNFANTMGDLSYAIHAAHRSLFITPMGTWHAPYLNISKVHQKWTHSHSFIFNLFFSQSPILIFANKSLKNEVYAANWSYRIMNYELFKYMVPFFYFKDNPYGNDISLVYSKLSSIGVDSVFVADVKFHKRTLFFLKKWGVYTIGLAPYNIDPWVLHYSIPVAASTLFTQYFFTKLMIYMRQEANIHYYNQLKSLWLER
jgi:hypothetical protein